MTAVDFCCTEGHHGTARVLPGRCPLAFCGAQVKAEGVGSRQVNATAGR